MSITDLASLQSTVVDYLDRPDLSSKVPDFIALAEARFNQTIRSREMEKAGTSPVAADGVTDLPDDFLEWIAVLWTGLGRTARPAFAEADSPEIRFRYRPAGDPQYYTVVAGKVALVPARAGALALSYYAAIPPLANGPNWLITKSPDAYLYATLAEAYLYQKDPDRAQAHLQMAMQSMQGITTKADTQKTARRPAKQTEVAAATQADSRPE